MYPQSQCLGAPVSPAPLAPLPRPWQSTEPAVPTPTCSTPAPKHLLGGGRNINDHISMTTGIKWALNTPFVSPPPSLSKPLSAHHWAPTPTHGSVALIESTCKGAALALFPEPTPAPLQASATSAARPLLPVRSPLLGHCHPPTDTLWLLLKRQVPMDLQPPPCFPAPLYSEISGNNATSLAPGLICTTSSTT